MKPGADCPKNLPLIRLMSTAEDTRAYPFITQGKSLSTVCLSAIAFITQGNAQSYKGSTVRTLSRKAAALTGGAVALINFFAGAGAAL